MFYESKMKKIVFLFSLITFALTTEVFPDELSIVFTGDTKGYFSEETFGEKKSGGILERQKVIEDIRKKHGDENLLIFDTGDAFGHNYLASASSGRITLEYFSEIGYDAMVVGNHEFNFGKKVLESYKNNPNLVTILGANVIRDDLSQFLQPYKIIKKSGIKIGVLGITDPKITESVLSKNLEGLIIKDVDWAINKYLVKLKKKTDLIILLTHLSKKENIRIAKKYPGISIIIGKSSKELPDHFSSLHISSKFSTYIYSTSRFGRFLPHLKIKIENKKIREIKTVDLIELDSKHIKVSNARKQILKRRLEKSYLKHALQNYGLKPTTQIIRKDNLSRNSLKKYLLTMMLKKTHSEIAFINEGFFNFEYGDSEFDRESIFNLRSFEKIFWIENTLVTLRLEGEEILKIIEKSKKIKESGGDHYVNYLSSNSNKKLSFFNVHGRKISKKFKYTVVTSNFLLSGGDGFTEFETGEDVNELFSGDTIFKKSLTGKEKSIRKEFIKHLVKNKNRKIQQDYFYPVWFSSIRKIGLFFERRVKKNDEIYASSSVYGLTGEEKTAFSSDIDLKISLETKDYNWENYIKSEFGVIKLGGAGAAFEESDDQWSIESLVEFKFIEYPIRTVDLHPFVSGKFLSEFSSFRNNELSRDIQLQVGVTLSDIWNFRENRIGLVHLTRLSQDEELYGNVGIGIHSMYSSLGESGSFSEFGFVYYFTSAKKTGQDAGRNETKKTLEFDWSYVLTLERWENFSFNPNISFFAYKDQPEDNTLESKWAYSLHVKLGLIFNKNWKIW